MFISAHGSLDEWMTKPVPARLVDLQRIKAWPLITWAVLTRQVHADIGLLTGRHLGAMHRIAEHLFPDEFIVVRDAARARGRAFELLDTTIPLTLK